MHLEELFFLTADCNKNGKICMYFRDIAVNNYAFNGNKQNKNIIIEQPFLEVVVMSARCAYNLVLVVVKSVKCA